MSTDCDIMRAMHAIEVSGLVKRYGALVAVDGISFTVERGEVFGLLGPNGAGKTTTVEVIEGLRKLDDGTVRVLDTDVVRNSKEIKQRIGIQLQTSSLFESLTAREVLDLFGSFYRKKLPADELISLLNLQEKRNSLVKNLSGGQQQRLSVALALVNDPEVVFLDEPTTGLDPQARRALWEVIEHLKRRDRAILLTTHQMEEAERLCDRVAIIDHGHILAMGKPRDLVKSNFEEVAIEFEADGRIDLGSLKGLEGVSNIREEEGVVTVYTKEAQGTLAVLLSSAAKGEWQMDNMRVRVATLEDVFLKLTGRRIRE
ncbi:MAG: ABC transporter ATP-binding protein [Dehalococcoidales bacterium]|nr:ABC transporter ATP-binding protein [Dehalococcoidales bacterium]